ncbi:MAG TPA: hypothetical protein VGM37_17790 [Armatimonadota bacterium]|jgi:hypothetical protein
MERACLYLVIFASRIVPFLFVALGFLAAWTILGGRRSESRSASTLWTTFRAVEALTGGVCLAASFNSTDWLLLVGTVLLLHASTVRLWLAES